MTKDRRTPTCGGVVAVGGTAVGSGVLVEVGGAVLEGIGVLVGVESTVLVGSGVLVGAGDAVLEGTGVLVAVGGKGVSVATIVGVGATAVTV